MSNLSSTIPPSHSLRSKVFQVLEHDLYATPISRLINLFLIALIAANVFAVVLESEPAISDKYGDWFYYFELVSVTIFTCEYLLRVWCCIDKVKYKGLSSVRARIRYIISPISLIDLIAILPFFISLFINIDLRYLRLLRVMRLMKLTHHFSGFNVFITVVSKEAKSIAIAVMVMLFLIIIAASLMYTLENQQQPEVFGSILHSLWWAVVTMTTVGYGDVTPITNLGKVVATFIMLLGVGLVALPAAILAARFGEELRERKQRLNIHISHALSDGKIDDQEYQLLCELAERLDLSPEELEKSIKLLAKGAGGVRCPVCGK